MKSPVIYYILTLPLVLIAIAAACFTPVAAAPFIILLLWWTLYYKSLKYQQNDNAIIISSGVVLHTKKIIPISNILYSTAVRLPFSDKTILTVIHTYGAQQVILGDFSTLC